MKTPVAAGAHGAASGSRGACGLRSRPRTVRGAAGRPAGSVAAARQGPGEATRPVETRGAQEPPHRRPGVCQYQRGGGETETDRRGLYLQDEVLQQGRC